MGVHFHAQEIKLTPVSPPRPEAMDWTEFYPAFALSERRPEDAAETGTTATPTPSPLSKPVEVADIGCGFGGLLVALGPKMPDTLLLGTLSEDHP